jgi:hypothetical protein
MKALVTAFALLSFVAATTIPYVASAATQTEQGTKKKAHKASKKSTKKASTKKSHKKSTKKAAQPA